MPSSGLRRHGRRSRGEYVRFVSIANGSLRELETHLLLIQRRKLVPEAELQPLFAVADEIGRLLTGLHRRLTGANPCG